MRRIIIASLSVFCLIGIVGCSMLSSPGTTQKDESESDRAVAGAAREAFARGMQKGMPDTSVTAGGQDNTTITFKKIGFDSRVARTIFENDKLKTLLLREKFKHIVVTNGEKKWESDLNP